MAASGKYFQNIDDPFAPLSLLPHPAIWNMT